MLNEQIELDYLLKILASWESEIQFNSYVSYTDINKAAEGFSLKLLNLIYDYHLVDLNDIKRDHPGVDLGDETKSKVAFQVTSRSDAAKVVVDLKTVVKHGLDKIYTGGIKFFIIRHATIKFGSRTKPTLFLPSFDVKKDIVYLKEVSEKIKQCYHQDYPRFLEIKELCEKELRPVSGEHQQSPDTPNLAAIVEQLSKQLAAFKGAIAPQSTIENDFSLGLRLPQIQMLAERNGFVSQLEAIALNSPVIWLYGDVGTGKTNIAFLLAKKQSNSVYWLETGGLVPTMLPVTFNRNFTNEFNIEPGNNLLQTLDLIFENVPENACIIINDLPDLAGNETIIKWFIELIYAIISSERILIITSNYQTPTKIKTQFSDQFYQTGVPVFDDQDITEVLNLMGAPLENVEELTMLVSYLSEGHPIIVNAIISYLREKAWEVVQETLNHIFKHDYASGLNNETYTRLIDSTEDEATRELLFRLKLITGSFTEKEIRVVSDVSPLIKMADQKINKLNGVWLRVTQNSGYQLSPLIKRLGQNLDEELVKNIYRQLAASIIDKRKLNQYDFGKAITYYINGDANADAAMLLVRALNSLLSTPKLFYDFGFNLYWYFQEMPTDIPLVIRIFIRFLQMNIAMTQKEDTSFLWDDLQRLGNRATDDFSLGMVNLIAYRLHAEDTPIAAMTQLSAALKHLYSEQGESHTFGFGEDNIRNGAWVTFYNLKPDEYKDWFAKVGELNLTQEMLSPESNASYSAAGPMIYVNLFERDLKGQWDKIKAILYEVLGYALETNLGLIAAYALKNLVYLICQEEKDFAAAPGLIAEYENLLLQHPIFRYIVIGEYGRQLFYAVKNDEAYEQLSLVIGTSLPPYFSEAPETQRIYGQLSAKYSEFSAHEYSLKALKTCLDNKFNGNLERVQLFGELGISFWLIGNNEQAVRTLEQGYDLLNSNFIDTLAYKAAVIRYGHVGNYINRLMITGQAPTETLNGEYVKPYRGFFYGNDEALLDAGFYFDERRYVTSLIFQDAYEFLGEYEKAKKWALISIQVSISYEDMQFSAVLGRSLFYLIQEGDLNKVYTVYNYMMKHLDSDKAKPFKTLSAADNAEMQKRQSEIQSDDLIFYEYVLVPITYQLILDIITGNILPEDFKQAILKIFENPNLQVKDKETLQIVRRIFDGALLNNGSIQELAELTIGHNQRFTSQLQVIMYMLYSLNSTAEEAARYQLVVLKREIEIFNRLNHGGYRFFLVPFYVAFWLIKFAKHENEFKNKDFWYSKSLSHFQDAHWNEKLRRLFEVLVNHLAINVGPEIEEWLMG